LHICNRGTAVVQWLRYCASNHKVAGSIPDGVMEFFIDINPSDRTMALELTQPLTEMSTRSISWGQMRPVRKADKLLGTLTSWNPLSHARPVTGQLTLYICDRKCNVNVMH
jgi:hypothetical protein